MKSDSFEYRGKHVELVYNKHHFWHFGIKYHHGFYFETQAKFSVNIFGWSLFVDMPWHTKDSKQAENCEWPSYGISAIDGCGAFSVYWGHKYKRIRLPWCREWYRTSYLMKDGISWKHKFKRPKRKPGEPREPWYDWREDPELFRETHDYRYLLASGTVQERKATIQVDEMEWRIWWAKWCPLFARIKRGIEVTFNEEVGERTGSWKGGATGCGMEMLPGEPPLECLRRMESTRVFN